MIWPMRTITLKKTGCIDSACVVVYSSSSLELAVLLVENNMEASMSRARSDVRHEVALALAQYLSLECRADPNPSGHSAPRPTKVADSEPAAEVAPAILDNTAPALVRDVEYSVEDAGKITHLAESTLRKMMSDGRLPFRKAGARSLISGKRIAEILAKQQSQSTEPVDED